MTPLEQLKPIILGSFRDYIIGFEGSDWCCRQSAIYVTYVLRHFGHDPVLLEGLVSIQTKGRHDQMSVDHAWVALPREGILIDLMLTQANWIMDGIHPAEDVIPIWGHDPKHITREVRSIWTDSYLTQIMGSEHWQRPGLLYRDICLGMLTHIINNRVVVPSYVAMP